LESRKASAGIEAGPAEPVNRAVFGDEGGGFEIADQRVVFDARGHGAHLEEQKRHCRRKSQACAATQEMEAGEA